MSNKNKILILSIFLIGSVMMINICCKRDNKTDEQVFGFEFLKKIPGLWHGPVSSSTRAGNFDNWYVDFRPVSAAQVSQFSLLDTNTVNNISFFIVKHDNKLKVAMRTEGCHRDTCCVTYEVMDSVADAAGYYRFSDFVKSTQRAYTEFRFTGEQLEMKVYTNKFNRSDTMKLHTTWTAQCGGRSSATETGTHFDYPQPMMIKDFSTAFNGMSESIFFTFENDPYTSITQPYVGSVTANISISNTLTTSSTDEVFLLFTTEPLFDGFTYIPDNLKYISKYVFLSVGTHSYRIKDIHPGKYYIYSLIDRNHDHLYLSGDYMNSNVTNSFTVTDKQDATINTVIDYIIP